MYLVSACLAGINCRYNGSHTKNDYVLKLVKEGKAIPICPEVIAGLKTPRTPCEIVIDGHNNKKVVDKEGNDFTKEFYDGAYKTLEVAKTLNVKEVILQSKSPSCGYGWIYDGTFTNNLIKSNGLTAQLLLDNGIKVFTEKNINKRAL
ncbi:uncharacterized protein YbbK (DUF523 family) [Natranaerovirga hydrolytica]|uniref:Uncharacterized protein YbbK (DUF523 family) n=1 Tax=Natranaerovirga hydrolytica TaxID=680378 RepID=A0A4R1MTE5_9FIRM|nr:DUF523 domain-containing protein [Natranaerovirga hydrolytica]TCK93233.1 uncharacterized protein YbbK (DUF523 family) [Natranaerovirga hydrolytica]